MSYNLFLDDVRQPQQVALYIHDMLKEFYIENEWVIVRNFKEFSKYIRKHGMPNVISFDHDLADIHYDPRTWTESFKYDEKTGYDCAKWLLDYCREKFMERPKIILCHSQNPVGKDRIQNLFK